MRWPWGHPDFETLSRFVHDELGPRRRDRVAEHLAGCGRCRNGVRFIHELRDTARELPAPEPAGSPNAVLSHVLARRAAGDRVILPTSGPVRIDGDRPRGLVPAALLIPPLRILAALIVGVPRLRADHSRLEFLPARPHEGERIEVTYKAGALLAGEQRLVLRARFREAAGRVYDTTVATLVRSEGQTYRAAFDLPDSAVYGLFAVEDLSGTRLDHHGRRFWELATYDDRGRARYAALRARVFSLTGLNWRRALEAARDLADQYPGRVGGWYLRYLFERDDLGSAARDSLTNVYRERLQQLDRAAARRQVPATEAADFAFFALTLGDGVLSERWLDRLRATDPDHRVLGELEIARLHTADRNDPERLDAALEELWNAFQGLRSDLVRFGFDAARGAGDLERALTWIDRAVSTDPRRASSLLLEIAAEEPAAREWAMDRMRRRLEALRQPPGDERPIQRSVPDELRLREREAARLLAGLGSALIAEGRIPQGLDTLALAARRSWDPNVFRSVAETFLAAGDTAEALRHYAFLAVDPFVHPAERDSIARLAAARVTPDRWRRWSAEGHAAMRRHHQDAAIQRRLAGRILLTNAEGRSQSLHTVVNGRATLIAFWPGRPIPPLSFDAEQIGAVTPEIERMGGRVVVITGNGPQAPTFADWLTDYGLDTPVLHDSRGDAMRSFEQWAVPAYYVLDRNGRIRFEGSSPQTAIRHLVILLRPEPPDGSVVVEATE